MSTIKRIGKGMGAYSYAQLVTVGTQLLGLPVFLSFWSMEQYGIWLMLSAIPVYFTMSDFGIVAVAGNKMTMAVANNDLKKANSLFQCAFLMTVCTVFTILLIVSLFIYNTDFGLLADKSNKIVLLLLIVSSLLSVLGGLVDAIFRANNKYSTGTYLVTTARLFEWVFCIFSVYLFNDIVFAAVGYLVGRILMTLFNFVYSIKRFENFKWSFQYAEWKEIKVMLKPSFAFMLLPISNAINLQGVTLIVGGFMGPISVVIFNTYRTLSRFLIQGASIICKPLWPEYSKLYGKNKIAVINVYYKRSLLAATFLMGLGAIFLYLFSGYIFEYWTDGKVTIVGNVYYLLVLAAVLSGINQVSTTILSATNQHIRYFQFIFIISVLVVGISFEVIKHYELEGVVIVLLFSELALLIMSSLLVFNKILRKENKMDLSE